MKICHFSSVHSIWDTRVFYRECVSLAKKHEVTLIAIGKFSGYKLGVKVIGIEKPKSFLTRFTITTFKVIKEAFAEEAEMYHIHDAEMLPFGIALSLMGKKVIYDIHENTYQDILLKPWISPLLKRLASFTYHVLLKISKQFMHFIVVVANPRLLKAFFVNENECTIVQNFADIQQLLPFRLSNREALDGNELFYIGMIRDMYYEVDYLLEAIWLLKKQGLEVTLHLIGYFGNATLKGFEHLTYWEDIKNNIIVYGKLNWQEAYAISKRCKIGICLKNQPQEILVSHERKLFEYMAIGLPAIFCNSHIYQELNLKCAIGEAINLTKAEEFCFAIRKLLLEPHLLNMLSQNAIFWSDKSYNWDMEFINLQKAYSSFI